MNKLIVDVFSEGKKNDNPIKPPEEGSAQIIVNGKTFVDASGNNGRGIHIVVVDEMSGDVVDDPVNGTIFHGDKTGKLKGIYHFRTWDDKAEGDRLAKIVNAIPVGRVVALAVCDEAARYITGNDTADTASRNDAAIAALKSLGSTNVESLAWRNSWALVTHKGLFADQKVEVLRVNLPASCTFERKYFLDVRVTSRGLVEKNGAVLEPGLAKIVVNGVTVLERATQAHRGIHLAVINEFDGRVLDTKHFRTHDNQGQATALAKYIKGLEDGAIVALAVCDEGSRYVTGLGSNDGARNDEAVAALRSLGSRMIGKLSWRKSWALIGHKATLPNETVEVLLDGAEASVEEGFRKRMPVHIDLECNAATKSAKLTLNKAEVHNRTERDSGILVAVIDDINRALLHKRYFEIGTDPQRARRKFRDYVGGIDAGRIVIVAALGNAAGVIADRTHHFAAEACRVLGATKVDGLGAADSWALIGQKGSHRSFTVKEEHQASGTIRLQCTISTRDSSIVSSPNVEGISCRNSLTMEYDGGKDKPRAVHRAILSFPSGTEKIALSAGGEITVTIGGQAQPRKLLPGTWIDVEPNQFGKLVITHPADTFGLPAIYVRAGAMSADEKFVVALDSHAFEKLARLDDHTLFKDKAAFGIKAGASEAQCRETLKAVATLAQAHHATYNYVEGAKGICRDRYVRGMNMKSANWCYSTGQGTRDLTPDGVHDALKDVNIRHSTAQWWGEDVCNAIGTAAHESVQVVVHVAKIGAETIVRQGENIVTTAGSVASHAADTLKTVADHTITGVRKTCDDLVHGNVTGALHDVYDMGHHVVGDVLTGGENIARDVLKGAVNALVITVKRVGEAAQYILDHTGKLGEAIKGFLSTIAEDVKKTVLKLCHELAEFLEWDKILDLQRHVTKSVNDTMDKIPQIVKLADDLVQSKISKVKQEISTTIRQARRNFGTSSSATQHLSSPQTSARGVNKSREHTDWIMSRMPSGNDQEVAAVRPIPMNILEEISSTFEVIQNKFTKDSLILNAVKNLKEDF